MVTYSKKFLKIVLQSLATILIIGVVSILLKLIQSYLESQLIALLYLLPVIGCTVLWGLSSGLLAGFLAFFAFNYFFVPPYFTLLVHKSQDVISLLIFLVVAVVVSQLIGQARKAAMLAREHEWEAVNMYELISALAGLTDASEVSTVLKRHIVDTFHFDRVEIDVNNEETKTESQKSEEKLGQADLVVFMRTARNSEGKIRIWAKNKKITPTENRLLEAFSYQGASTIERIRLFKREGITKVLEESDKIKTSLLNSVSHELRSPLAAIKASVSSLRSGAVPWENPARDELLSMIEEETDQLNLLVGNLLDMSRIEAGSLLPKCKWNSLSEILSEAVGKMRFQLSAHSLHYKIPDDFPLIPTDFVLMTQVFSNLLSNSAKYAPAGTPILIDAKVVDSNAQISLTNQSNPVPEEHLDHIFDKFIRITKADKITGTGLGLSICKGIVEAHKGKIWAENQSSGFTFVILLPLTLDGNLPRVPKDEIDG